MKRTSTSIEKVFTQSDFDAFASLSGDNNPIHVDPEFSAATRFGRTVAHGMLLHSIFRGLIATLLPAGRLLSQTISFTAPTYASEPMRFDAEIVSDSDGVATVSLSCTRLQDRVITCTSEARFTTTGPGA